MHMRVTLHTYSTELHEAGRWSQQKGHHRVEKVKSTDLTNDLMQAFPKATNSVLKLSPTQILLLLLLLAILGIEPRASALNYTPSKHSLPF